MKNIKIQQINKIKIVDMLVLLFAVFMIRPYYIQILVLPNKIWAYLSLLLSLVSSIIVMQQRRLNRLIGVLLFFGIYIAATLLFDYNNLPSAISLISQAILGYNTGVLYTTKKYKESVELVVPKVFSLYLYLDCVVVFFNISTRVFGFKNTITFLGYDNYAAFYILPMMAVIMGLSFKKNGKLLYKDWILWCMCTISKIWTRSYAACIVFIIYIFLIFIVFRIKGLSRIVTVKNALIVVTLLFIGVYFFSIQSVLSDILIAMGKGVELNSRTIIWEGIINGASNVSLIGLGNHTAEQFIAFFGFPFGWGATHAHNILLDLFVQTGIVGLILFVRIINVPRSKNKMIKNKWFRIIVIGLVCYIFLGFFDFYFYIPSFWLLVALANNEVCKSLKCI